MKFRLSVLLAVVFASNVTAQLPSWRDLAEQARWAANAHNVQSWRLEAVEGRPDQRRLTLDPARLLPETDPPSRQLTISLGAFLAVLENEAARRGASVSWEPLAEHPGALVTLSAKPGTVDIVLDALSAPTVKYRTATLVLSPDLRSKVEGRSSAGVRVAAVSDPAPVETALAWAKRAYRIEMALPRTRDESMVYTVYGADARRQKPWGITLVPNFPQGELFWIETLASWFPQKPAEYTDSAVSMFEKALVPVREVIVITSAGNGNAERLRTGEVLQRVWLDVRAAGGELLPLSQGLQEFAEMAEPYAEAHRRWARAGETVQLVLAVFRPQAGTFERSPRLSAEQILR